MTKTTWFLIGLTVVLLVTSFCFYRKTDYLERRLECLGDNVVYACDSICASQFERYEFREQQYIRQQDRDTNLILVVFAILVTITGAVTYKVGDDRISSLKDEYDEKIKRQEAKYKDAQDFINKTEAKVNYETYLSRMSESKRELDNGNKAIAVFLALAGLSYSAGYYYYLTIYDKPASIKHLRTITSSLTHLLSIIGSDQLLMTVVGKPIEKVNVDGTLNALLKLNIEEINNLVYQIQMRLKYS